MKDPDNQARGSLLKNAIALTRAERIQEVLDIYLSMTRENPCDAEVLGKLGWVWALLGNTDAASNAWLREAAIWEEEGFGVRALAKYDLAARFHEPVRSAASARRAELLARMLQT